MHVRRLDMGDSSSCLRCELRSRTTAAPDSARCVVAA